MKTSWYIKNVSNKRVQLLHLTYDDESKDLEIKDAETNSKIVLFIENLDNFNEQFKKIIKLISRIETINNKEIKSPSESYITEIRKKYKNAYKPWSKKDDNDLIHDFKKDYDLKIIAKKFDRQIGGIKSRLRKLKLIEDI
jgi:Asp-tRNA(Asn)/Glu-tRNA(Gln) amidotransferase C subunit